MTTPDAARRSSEDATVEAVALAILNDDRRRAGLSPASSRDDIPDSWGYVENARAAIAADPAREKLDRAVEALRALIAFIGPKDMRVYATDPPVRAAIAAIAALTKLDGGAV